MGPSCRVGGFIPRRQRRAFRVRPRRTHEPAHAQRRHRRRRGGCGSGCRACVDARSCRRQPRQPPAFRGARGAGVDRSCDSVGHPGRVRRHDSCPGLVCCRRRDRAPGTRAQHRSSAADVPVALLWTTTPVGEPKRSPGFLLGVVSHRGDAGVRAVRNRGFRDCRAACHRLNLRAWFLRTSLSDRIGSYDPKLDQFTPSVMMSR